MDLNAIRMFVAVVQAGSLSAAATRLGTPLPTLSLSLPQAFEPWWDLLAAFRRRYPDIQVHVYSTERRVDLIEDGIDVALRVDRI